MTAFATTGLPSSVDLSNSDYFPAIRSQGQYKGSCVFFSTTYYQYSYMANSLNDISSKNLSNCYSPEWTYLQFYYGDSRTERMCNYIKQSGCVKWNECLYSETLNDDVKIENVSEKALMDALYTKINSWGTIHNTFQSSPIIQGQTNSELNILKQFLNNGILLHANLSWLPDIKYSSEGEEVAIRSYKNADETKGPKTGGHAVTIVGYDDTVWCDVNGNGIKDAGETGAFKIANSHGDGFANDGYIWFLYDSLNGTSQISGNWENSCIGERLAAFGSDIFYLTVKSSKPNVVARVEYSNLTHANLKSTLTTSKNTNSIEQVLVTPITATTSTVTRLYDYDALADSVNELIGTNSYSLILGMQNSTKAFTSAKFSLIDSNLNVIASRSSNIISNGTYNITKNMTLGDVDYDGTIETDDAQLVLNYALNMATSSNLQKILADYDGNGYIEIEDAQQILKIASGIL